MKVCVCGGREFGSIRVRDENDFPREAKRRGVAEVRKLFDFLDALHSETPISEIIHGGARGADTQAGLWARWRTVAVRVFEANWEQEGKAAGVLRNQLMLEEGRPDLLVAFSGGRGTADCVLRARKMGIPVRVVE